MKTLICGLLILTFSICAPAQSDDPIRVRFERGRVTTALTERVRVVYSGTRPIVITVVAQANDVLGNNEFYKRIAKKDDFTYTDESPKDIAGWIKESTLTVTVRVYKGKPGSPTTAYVDPKFPNTIFLNSRKLGRDTPKIVNTIIHECVHTVDRSLTNARFGHGDNRRRGKRNSAPYWIGRLAERILNGVSSAKDHTIVNDPIRFVEEAEEIDESLIEDK
jgi:hypothetical protein